MNYILFDDACRNDLLPFTHTRPVADVRCGILTMRERWEMLLNAVVSQRDDGAAALKTATLTEDYLQKVFPATGGGDAVFINGAVFGSASLAEEILNLGEGQALTKGEIIIAVRCSAGDYTSARFPAPASAAAAKECGAEVYSLKNAWDIFSLNDRALRDDYKMMAGRRESALVPEHVTVSGKEFLFIEPGANIYAGCVINASTGPVYIGKDAEILEGSMMRGPVAVCEHAVLKMGAKVYGATTIGPGCKVGGEINNAVFFANSNKSHDGYLGNAVIGEWCNLGADTNCSNLKNNYDEVKVWHEYERKFISTGLIFCGLLMGDHSKCGINTMFNTGTVAGVSCNIFGGGFPEKFIPSFSWGGGEGMVVYEFNKAMETANRMMGRRGRQLTKGEIEMFWHIFEQSHH